MDLAGGNDIKAVYDLQSYWTTCHVNGRHLGFTFLIAIDRMTEVLAPDIYRDHWPELTDPGYAQ
jgi:hypothetical protein